MESVKRNQSYQLKIAIFGDSHCGKSTLVQKFAKNDIPQQYEPTVYDIATVGYEYKDKPYEMSLMDTSGKATDFAIRLPLLECDAVMVCFELGNSTSFGNAIAHWLHKISKLGNK